MDRKKTVASNFIWRLLEKSGAQGITFIVSVILARILDPNVYGVVAIVTIFTNIINVFVDSGFGNALIQKKDADDIDFSSVFYFNVFVCLIMYGLMYIASPYIAKFYDIPILTPIVRIMSLTIVISGLKNIQQAYVSKHLLFKRFFFSTLGGTIAAGIVGITMAYLGFGVWALVVQALVNNAIDTLILWFTVKWRPKLIFSWTRLRSMLSFGFKLLIAHLLDTLYKNIRSLLIGKFYDEEALAFYNRGNQMPRLILTNTTTALDSILLPVMSKDQNELTKLKEVTRKVNSVSCYIVWPLLIGLAAVGTPFISVLLTDKWLPCVPFLQILSLSYLIWPIRTANLNAIKAIGRGDVILKLEIITKIISVAIIIISLPYGPLAIAYGELIYAPIHVLIEMYPNKKLLNYSIGEQIRDILPTALLSSVMATGVLLVGRLQLSNIIILALQIIFGIAIYISLSVITRNKNFKYILSIIRK